MSVEQQLSKMTKHQKDWVGVYGNTFKAKKKMLGTCELCVWGTGYHDQDCMVRMDSLREAWSIEAGQWPHSSGSD